jgi:thymidylate kinase
MNKELTVHFQEKVRAGVVNFTAIDGLDGAGKKTVSKIVAETVINSGRNCLLVPYPRYDTPWGKMLRRLLTITDEDLSLEERMLAYALNRLETIPLLIETALKLTENEQKLIVVFDRYPTSNVLTWAYYQQKLDKQDQSSVSAKTMSELYETIWQVDSQFERYLRVRQNCDIHVLTLETETALAAISADGERQDDVRLDKYEVREVQALADRAYNYLAEQSQSGIISENIYVHKQLYAGGKRLTPNAVAAKILQADRNQLNETPFGRGELVDLSEKVVDIGENMQNILTDLVLSSVGRESKLYALGQAAYDEFKIAGKRDKLLHD